MKVFFVVISFLLFAFAANGQLSVMHGSVADSLTRAALYPANVVLREANSRNYLKGTITNESGHFRFTEATPGNYLLTVSYLGYRSKELPVTVGSEKQTDVGNILLAIAPFRIGEVEIIVKPLVQYGNDSDVTLNLDMLGDVGEQSVYDVINSLVGLSVDFNDKIRYNGYTDFTVLIDGKRLGATYTRMSEAGNIETYMLKRIPAKYIKTVEILPEPKGKYGYYSPVINMIPKGNLRDFYTVFTEAGIKDKYGTGIGVSRVYKKLSVTPEISYKHPAVFSQEDEDREYDANPGNSFTRNSYTGNWGIDKKAALRAEYRFEDTHALKFSVEGNFTENTTDITRNTFYADGKNDHANDSRYSDASRYQYTMGYRKSFYIGEGRFLRMNVNASVNKNSGESEQDITDFAGIKKPQKYHSGTMHESKGADLQLNYHNSKHRLQHFFDVGFLWNESDENTNRKLFNHSTDNWEELTAFSSDQIFSRLSSDVSFKLRRMFKISNENKTIQHSFNASISENLSLEKIADNLKDRTSKEQNVKTSLGFDYRGHLSEYGTLVFSYNGRLSRPTAGQLLETPVYIDEYTIRTGNSGLKPEMVNILTANYTWNAANVMRISNNPPPRFGYSFRASYSASSNKIVQSHSIDDKGILTYSYKNSIGAQTVSVTSDFYTRVSTFMNIKLAIDYKYDTYDDNAQSIRSGNSWSANSSVDVKLFRRLKLEAKYQYNSPRIFYQGKSYGYHDGRISMSTLVWKNNLDLSLEATNLLSHSGRKTVYYGEGYNYKTINYPEFPIIWLRASLMLFKFQKK